jgi:hypothetical protein
MLYHINYNNQQILFIQTGAVGSGAIVHYITQSEKPSKKFIDLKTLTGEFELLIKLVLILNRCTSQSWSWKSPPSDFHHSSANNISITIHGFRAEPSLTSRYDRLPLSLPSRFILLLFNCSLLL